MAQREGKATEGVKARVGKPLNKPYPVNTVEDALEIAQAIVEHGAAKPMDRVLVAKAVGRSPSSSEFRDLLSSSGKYGLTVGSKNSDLVELTDLGRKLSRPENVDERGAALVDAILNPELFARVLRYYDQEKLPTGDFFENALVRTFGVPLQFAAEAAFLVRLNAKLAGVLIDAADGKGEFVDLRVWSHSSTRNNEEDKPVSGAQRGTTVPPSELVPDLFGGVGALSLSSQPKETSAKNVVATKSSGTQSPPTDPSTSGPLRRGLIVDAYQLEQRLGAGFSAEVWRARVNQVPQGVQVRVGQEVAIKFYHQHAMAIPDQVVRVEREYRIAQQIRNDNLIRIYEFVLASSRPHHNFLVMDLARGKTLKDLIRREGMPIKDVIRIAKQLASALASLHGYDALHRDIKPGNISVDVENDMHVVLLDLGIVTVLHEKSMTAASRFLGSKHWAPYEQLVGETLDSRSDLYSLGAVIYNMLSGEPPYPDKTTEAAVAVEMQVRPLKLHAALDAPAELKEVVNACLSPVKSDRPNSVSELLKVLDRLS